jgi:hypothetical protein
VAIPLVTVNFPPTFRLAELKVEPPTVKEDSEAMSTGLSLPPIVTTTEVAPENCTAPPLTNNRGAENATGKETV